MLDAVSLDRQTSSTAVSRSAHRNTTKDRMEERTTRSINIAVEMPEREHSLNSGMHDPSKEGDVQEVCNHTESLHGGGAGGGGGGDGAG